MSIINSIVYLKNSMIYKVHFNKNSMYQKPFNWNSNSIQKL